MLIVDKGIDRINLRTMRSAAVVEHYSCTDELMPHERAALDHVANEMRGGSVLDLGVGAGRTVKALLEVSPDYLGIDYSQEMISACEARFPGIRFEHADARRLPHIRDASVSLAVFSCNGISMVDHEDRLAILREVHRVLKSGGVFLFTTYNRNSPEAVAGFRFPELQFSKNPARTLVRLARWIKDTSIRAVSRHRFVKLEVHAGHYAVLNDVCHNYGVMLYYITLADQRRQLEDTGFQANAVAFDRTGGRIGDDTMLDSMALIARKP